MYEIAMSQAIGKPLVIITSDAATFDFSRDRFVHYNPKELLAARAPLEKAIRAALGRDRLVEAGDLLDAGHPAAAAAMLGIALEQALAELTERAHPNSPTRTERSPVSPSQMAKHALEQQLIDSEEYEDLRRLTQVRNAAVHGQKAPSTADVRTAIEALRRFVEKHHLLA